MKNKEHYSTESFLPSVLILETHLIILEKLNNFTALKGFYEDNKTLVLSQ